MFELAPQCSNLSLRLSGGMVAQRLAHHLEAAGMADRGFTPHSFRAGFITEAHRQGKAAVDIKRISGHRSQSTFERYIRRTDHFEGHAGDFYTGVEEAVPWVYWR